jgi:hypothetical protein
VADGFVVLTRAARSGNLFLPQTESVGNLPLPKTESVGGEGPSNDHSRIHYPFVIATITITTRRTYLVSNDTETERSVRFTWIPFHRYHSLPLLTRYLNFTQCLKHAIKQQ